MTVGPEPDDPSAVAVAARPIPEVAPRGAAPLYVKSSGLLDVGSRLAGPVSDWSKVPVKACELAALDLLSRPR